MNVAGDAQAQITTHPVTHVLSVKTLPSNNIIIGQDTVQIRFLEQFIGMTAVPIQRICDEHLLGTHGQFLHVNAAYQIDISDEARKKTGVWATGELGRGSAVVHALVKHAAGLIGVKNVKKDLVNLVADRLTKTPIQDLRVALWSAAWLLSGDVQPPKRWAEPWESPVLWMADASVEPNMRLHTLYRRLVTYTLLLVQHQEAVNALGTKPSEQQRLRELTLDPNKVYDTIAVLSQWRQSRTLPLICALKISAIWS